MKTLNTILLAMLMLIACQETSEKESTTDVYDELKIYDSHVHLMSPTLIDYWKNLGIKFSNPDAYYSNIDTILKGNQADFIDLIGMGYVYTNLDYYEGEDGYEKMQAENDYLLKEAAKYPQQVKPYFTVDPLQDYALEELERCVQKQPKSGLKMHFSTSQVYLTVPEQLAKVKKVFHKAATADLPVLIHFDNWHPKFGVPDMSLLMDSILQDIPPIHLKIAHFGTSGGFNEKTKRVIDAFLELKSQNRIPEKHKIYFDISAVALDKDSEGVSKLSAEEFVELKSYVDKLGVESIVFGTDYPLYKSTDYLNVLRDKLGMTEEEIAVILSQRK